MCACRDPTLEGPARVSYLSCGNSSAGCNADGYFAVLESAFERACQRDTPEVEGSIQRSDTQQRFGEGDQATPVDQGSRDCAVD
jgi:hypothetical protein